MNNFLSHLFFITVLLWPRVQKSSLFFSFEAFVSVIERVMETAPPAPRFLVDIYSVILPVLGLINELVDSAITELLPAPLFIAPLGAVNGNTAYNSGVQ